MKRLWLNPHPKDLSKSPAVAGFFVCGMIGRFGYEKKSINYKNKYYYETYINSHAIFGLVATLPKQ